ncbi:MAG: HIRAN domain-containing protein [Nitrobacter sp.]|uniref:HIRAN domain-containing protein n=1 Tax=Nitrobacter sp. TaxID=29420 RepID=UPI0026358BE2|nr:HIRAN domain-containing protein [Nitrobacter sp.]MCV0387412.1 HIRAN domain-containing protein [Nitrobacter sp.]
MERWITTVHEPRRLLLAWQSPNLDGNRSRFAVGEVLRGDNGGLVLRYRNDEAVEEAKTLGYTGYPAFSPEKEQHSVGVREALLRRLPPRSRPDFAAYKAHFRLASDVHLSDMALLAYTEAKLPSDGFSLVNPLDDAEGPCQFLFEVAGYRHYAEKLKTKLEPGMPLIFVREPTNPHDSAAIRLEASGESVGYVNRLQTGAFHRWMKDGVVRAIVDRTNGTVARPRLLMFISVEAPPSKMVA